MHRTNSGWRRRFPINPGGKERTAGYVKERPTQTNLEINTHKVSRMWRPVRKHWGHFNKPFVYVPIYHRTSKLGRKIKTNMQTLLAPSTPTVLLDCRKLSLLNAGDTDRWWINVEIFLPSRFFLCAVCGELIYRLSLSIPAKQCIFMSDTTNFIYWG